MKGGERMCKKIAAVFDDNEDYRDLLEAILEQGEFKVISFADPCLFMNRETGTLCHIDKRCQSDLPCFDVLLTDNQMPGMTGVEFLERLKEKDCKIMDHRKAIFSGDWSSEYLKRAESLGCKIFDKPIPIKDIQAWLDGCIDA